MKKKVLILIFLALTLVGCAISKSFYIHQENYSEAQKEEVIEDVYGSLWILGLDSIPLSDWMTFQGGTEKGYFIERIVNSREEGSKTEYFLIFTTFYETDTVYYNYKIRVRTPQKDMWPKN